MKRKLLLFSFIFLCFVLFLSCSKTGKKSTHAEKPIVAVSILPQHYFISRIAGDKVEIVVLVGEGQSPHSYELSPMQMAQLSRASFWLLSGTEFEISLKPKIMAQIPNLSIIDGTKGVQFRTLEENHHDNLGEKEESHKHFENDTNIDRHTWLGRTPAIILSNHTYQALSSILPEHQETLDAQYQTLIKDINAEFDILKTELSFLKGATVLVFHPSFGYFLDEFGIIQRAIEVGGKEPSAKTLSTIIEQTKEEKIPAIFVQAQFSTIAAKTIAEQTGAQVISLDPLAKDWLKNISFLGEQLSTAYR